MSSTSSIAGSSSSPSPTASEAPPGSSTPAGSPSLVVTASGQPSGPPGMGMPPPPQCTDPQGCNAPPPATLYLYTFLSTLIILLLVSGGIIARSVVLRRRQQIAIANGWVPAPRRRENTYTTRPKPVMFDAYVVVDEPKSRAERWTAMKPFSASDVVPPPTVPVSPPQPEPPQPARPTRSVFITPFRAPSPPPPPTFEPAPPPSPSNSTEVRVAVLVAMPSQDPPQDAEDLPYLEFGIVDVELVDNGKMSSQSDAEGGAASKD
ncbi:hypothetical protein FB451DRAFT_119536 [Mycena latifolia]|nr:hypothetical protein FB451DRAFT_119536 [Mycena latifolia]